jgi:thiol:disulfide interchange protein DsbD
MVPMHAEASLAAQQPVRLVAQVKVLVCREMCIPGKAQVSLTLPVKSQSPAPDSRTPDVRTTDLFTATRKSLPRPAPGNWTFKVADTKDSFELTANLGHQIAGITQAIFFPLAESQIDNAAPQKFLAVASGFRLTLRKSNQLLKPIERLKGVLVFSTDRAYVIDAPVSKPGAAKSS